MSCHGVPGEPAPAKAGRHWVRTIDVTVHQGRPWQRDTSGVPGRRTLESGALRPVRSHFDFACGWASPAVRPGGHFGDIGAQLQVSRGKARIQRVSPNSAATESGRRFPPRKGKQEGGSAVLHYGPRAGTPGNRFRSRAGVYDRADGSAGPARGSAGARRRLGTIRTKDDSLSAQWEHTVRW